MRGKRLQLFGSFLLVLLLMSIIITELEIHGVSLTPLSIFLDMVCTVLFAIWLVLFLRQWLQRK